MPTPLDFRRKVVPLLVWSAAVVACCVMMADRFAFEHVPRDRAAATGSEAHVVAILGPSMPVSPESSLVDLPEAGEPASLVRIPSRCLSVPFREFAADEPELGDSCMLYDKNQGVAP